MEKVDQSVLEKFKNRIQKGAIVKALRGWKKSNIPFDIIREELLMAIDNKYKSRNVGIILSAYYEIGKCAKYSVSDLLDILFIKKEYPTFLKQAYRFGIFQGFEQKIETAISWHEEKRLPDAFAWKLKFEKLKETIKNEKLLEPDSNVDDKENNNFIKVIDNEESDKKKEICYFDLKAINRKENDNITKFIQEEENEPYILSQISKKKLENANLKHSNTLKLLKNELTSLGYEVTETEHIDAFSIIKDVPAIFEIKSINEVNENDQVRAAISQLYEYRFLYSLKDATLWIVFSEKPFSEWIIEYLSNDRQIKILWIEDDKITGLSRGHLQPHLLPLV